MYMDMKINEFLAQTASTSQMPGGGCCCAVTGAEGVSLLIKALAITIKKQKNKNIDTTNLEALTQPLENALAGFSKLVDDDANAFLALMDAYRKHNADAIALASINAAAPPIRSVKIIYDILPYAEFICACADKVIVSDAYIAVHLLSATAVSAKYTINVNAKTITDRTAKLDCKRSLKLIREISRKCHAITKRYRYDFFRRPK